MHKIKPIRIAVMTIFATVVLSAAAQGATLRAFVSSSGSDANVGADCPQTAPCRTFAAALPTVTPGGELIALDTSGYGPLTNINKSVSIMAVPGATALVVVAINTSGFTINGAATDVVRMRNISFNGSGAANTNGVRFNSGSALHVNDCNFTGLSKGIYDLAAPSLMYVSDSTLANLHEGIFLEPTDTDNTDRAKVFIEHCRFENYYQGLVAAGRFSAVTVRNSHFAGRSTSNLITYAGIVSAVNSAGTTHIMVENCVLTNNYLAVGTKTDGVAFISLSQNVIYQNNLGVFACCLSKMISFGNNRFENNVDDGSFNLSTDLK